MAEFRPPKQRVLTKHETIASYEVWQSNLVYHLSTEDDFKRFLDDGELVWKSTKAVNRGFADDKAPIPADDRLTAVQKSGILDRLLGQIANYCPVLTRSIITKKCLSFNEVWQSIRAHYNFQSVGSRVLDLGDIVQQPGDSHEDLFQQLMQFTEDILMSKSCGITHHGKPVDEDEELTPTLENMMSYIWLKTINPALPKLVKQKYGAELRNKSLASIRVEISGALPSLLDELSSLEESKAFRSQISSFSQKHPKRNFPKSNHQSKSCVLCKEANRPYKGHDLMECRFLPSRYKTSVSRRVNDQADDDVDSSTDEELDDNEDYHDTDNKDEDALFDTSVASRVKTTQSPVLNTYYESHPVKLTIDTGANTNMISLTVVKRMKIPISPASQMARQADGVTPLSVKGEVHCNLTRGKHTFRLDALVIDQLGDDVLAGTTFMDENDIAVRPAKRMIVIKGSDTIFYGPSSKAPTARRAQSYLLRAPVKTVLLPGDYLEMKTPNDLEPDDIWALHPRYDSPCNSHATDSTVWPTPQMIHSVDSSVRLVNTTSDPIIVKKNEHLCDINPVMQPTHCTGVLASKESSPVSISGLHSTAVSIDPDGILTQEERDAFTKINTQFDKVFDTKISMYNGKCGDIKAVVNMGPVLPPQHKGRMPQYNKDRMQELQDKCDELEKSGVLARPEDVGVTVEYVNPSFLVKKPNGGSRLVTSFGEVAQYSKPQPSLMPSVDKVLQEIASWKYIVITDLTQSFYQIPLSKASMKYCGICTPYKGTRIYTRSAMGMPGSETVLEELMSRILGDQVASGKVAKLADDLYVGADNVQDLIHNWQSVLQALDQCDLRLSARKSIICPKSANILGWIWSNGTIAASPHRIASLSAVSPPSTVQKLRSFIGAYKVLSRVLKGYATYLQPLEKVVAGRSSHEKITWSDELYQQFKTAQESLHHTKEITLPIPTDTLWLITDASVRECGLGATLYVNRNGNLLLSGFFNAKMKQHQITWLPCEVEALCIGAAVKHFSPFVIQSKNNLQVLTDSKPCIQAYQKLLRGQFSNSSRVTSFLSTVSRYNVQIQHIAGIANLPSDYSSRNPLICADGSCQICKFIHELEECPVRSITVSDVLNGNASMPFVTRASWLSAQQECKDLRRTHAHLCQGTRPSKKATTIPDVKRYLQVVTIASDGMLVVKQTSPLTRSLERIVVPRDLVDGLITAIHYKFAHPSAYQMKKIFSRYFYALDFDKSNDRISNACAHCSALKFVPKYLKEQHSTPPPQHVGYNFAADVMKRYGQLVLVIRETTSSFTATTLLQSERREELLEGLIILLSSLCALNHPVTIRVDAATGFTSLAKDPALTRHNISLDIGNPKNPNKNPVAERAIQEFGMECLNLSPNGNILSPVSLALATARLNSRIRDNGLSATEVWTQRDQISGDQLPIDDMDLIKAQADRRSQNHTYSERSKCPKDPGEAPTIHIGDLVFLKGERDKTKARSKYLVVDRNDIECRLRKFTSSQFRSKIYHVPLAECYPVVPTLIEPHDGPIRGLMDVDNSEFPLPKGHNPPPDMLVAPPGTNDHNSNIVQSSVNDMKCTRKSARIRKAPKWMDSTWNLST